MYLYKRNCEFSESSVEVTTLRANFDITKCLLMTIAATCSVFPFWWDMSYTLLNEDIICGITLITEAILCT